MFDFRNLRKEVYVFLVQKRFFGPSGKMVAVIQQFTLDIVENGCKFIFGGNFHE